MFLQDTLESIKSKVTGGGVKNDPAGLFDYSPGATGAVPGSGQVAQSYLQGKQLYGQALIKFNQERTNTAQGFGYQGDIDPNTGVMTNLRVDQTNPYGAYQMNRRAHADQWQALREQQAGRRIGSRGLGAQAGSDARFAWGGEDSQQAQDFIGRLAGIDQGQQQAYQGWQDTYWNALAEQTRQAIEDERFNSARWNGADGDEDEPTDTPPGVGTTAAAKFNPKSANPFGLTAKQAAANRDKNTLANLGKRTPPKPAPKKLPPGQARMKAAQAALAAKKKKK